MIRISICGMCKHFYGNSQTFACPAFPNGRKGDDCYPYADQECGNGYHFEPNQETAYLWDENMYKCFSRIKDDPPMKDIIIGKKIMPV